MCVHQSFDKLIWRTIGPKNFLFVTAQFSLWASGTVSYDYIVTQNVFPMAHTRTIVEPIWPMLQNVSKTLMYSVHVYNMVAVIIGHHKAGYFLWPVGPSL